MKPLDRRMSSAGLRHLPLILLVGLASGPALAGDAPPSAASPMANARLTVGGPAPMARVEDPAQAATAAPVIDPVAARVREHAARPLGGVSGIAVGSVGSGGSGGSGGGPSSASAGVPAAASALPGDDAALPVTGDGRFGGAGELLRVGAALGVVLAIAVVIARGVRRLGGNARAGRPAGVLEILARYPVGRGQQLVVLRLDRRLLLVHQGGGRMEPLTEVTQPDEVASLIGRLEAGASGSEADRFRRTLEEFEQGRGPAGLRPDGRFGAEIDPPFAARGRNGRAPVADDEPGGPGNRTSGLAAAIRAGRRQAAYGAARLAGESPRDAARPQVEIVDLTRTGGRGARR